MFSAETLAVACGLSSALTWGAGDFSGGFATRKGNVLAVVLFSQLLGVGLLLALQLGLAREAYDPSYWIWGAAAGLCGAFGLVALYTGLASGRMGVVAPVSAVVTAVVPMLMGFFIEGLPKASRLAGFGAGIAAVWLLSNAAGHSKIQRSELALAALAGLGFGFFFICIDRVSDRAIFSPLVAARIASISIIVVILAARRQMTFPGREQLPFIALAGVFDTAGNAFFALASHLGRLDVAAVLASMYPASTVMLAWSVLKERLRPQQWTGLLAALGALALIAA